MDAIISFANTIFKPLIDLGAAPMMTIFITLVSVLLGVKFSKALEGGIKLGIAITGIGAVISVLSGAFSSALTQFVESTGFQLTITDAGWPPPRNHYLGISLHPLLLAGPRDCQHRHDCAE